MKRSCCARCARQPKAYGGAAGGWKDFIPAIKVLAPPIIGGLAAMTGAKHLYDKYIKKDEQKDDVALADPDKPFVEEALAETKIPVSTPASQSTPVVTSAAPLFPTLTPLPPQIPRRTIGPDIGYKYPMSHNAVRRVPVKKKKSKKVHHHTRAYGSSSAELTRAAALGATGLLGGLGLAGLTWGGIGYGAKKLWDKHRREAEAEKAIRNAALGSSTGNGWFSQLRTLGQEMSKTGSDLYKMYQQATTFLDPADRNAIVEMQAAENLEVPRGSASLGDTMFKMIGNVMRGIGSYLLKWLGTRAAILGVSVAALTYGGLKIKDYLVSHGFNKKEADQMIKEVDAANGIKTPKVT